MVSLTPDRQNYYPTQLYRYILYSLSSFQLFVLILQPAALLFPVFGEKAQKKQLPNAK